MQFIPFTDIRAHLAKTLRELEASDEPVYISRRGEPAAVLLSVAQYRRLLNQADGPAARLTAWRTKYAVELEADKDEPDPWADVRDRQAPRPFTWPDDIAPPEMP